MSSWVRDAKRRRRIRFEPKLESKSQSKPKLKIEPERPLNDIFFILLGLAYLHVLIYLILNLM